MLISTYITRFLAYFLSITSKSSNIRIAFYCSKQQNFGVRQFYSIIYSIIIAIYSIIYSIIYPDIFTIYSIIIAYNTVRCIYPDIYSIIYSAIYCVITIYNTVRCIYSAIYCAIYCVIYDFTIETVVHIFDFDGENKRCGTERRQRFVLKIRGGLDGVNNLAESASTTFHKIHTAQQISHNGVAAGGNNVFDVLKLNRMPSYIPPIPLA